MASNELIFYTDVYSRMFTVGTSGSAASFQSLFVPRFPTVDFQTF